MNDMYLLYLAGPMRGKQLYNFPAFDHAREKLESMGYDVVSPADIDRAHGFDPVDLPDDYDWNNIPDDMDISEVLIRDFAELSCCDAIYLLDGWEASKGVQAELAFASALGIPAFAKIDDTMRAKLV